MLSGPAPAGGVRSIIDKAGNMSSIMRAIIKISRLFPKASSSLFYVDIAIHPSIIKSGAREWPGTFGNYPSLSGVFYHGQICQT